jgi:type IV pilus assembly protein PilC
MPNYRYFAKDSFGKSIKAREFAVSEYELKTRLARKNLSIISIKEVGGVTGPSLFGSRIKTAELVLFCKQLSTMIKGGVPLLRAVNSIAVELRNPVFRSTLEEIGFLVKGGETLSAGFKKFPGLFSPLFISIIEAGEKVGSLDTMLTRLGDYLLARDRLNKKIISAMTYPAFVVSFFILAMVVITVFLVPRFKAMYEGFGAKLPPMTQVVFNISDTVVNNIGAVIGLTFVTAFLSYRYFFRSVQGRMVLDNILIKMPIMGTVIKSAALSKFSRTLATLLSQGIPIAASLDLVSKSSGNMVIEKAINRVKSLIMDGESMPEALRKAQIFPPLMIQMVSVGVESGNLPDLLDKTADFYEDRVANFVAALTTLIEPVLIISLGVIVGIVIVALYMPILKLSQAVGEGIR